MPFIGCVGMPSYYNADPKQPSSKMTLVRHFNSDILDINGNRPGDIHYDFYVKPGVYSVTLQPRMFVSSFPYGNHLKEKKSLSFTAEANTILYICLGLNRIKEKENKFSWRPYVFVASRDHKRKYILQDFVKTMKNKGGCVSDRTTLPYSWIHH